MNEEGPQKTLSAKLHDGFWSSFQARTDFVETIKEDVRFYNGDQWPHNNVYNSIRCTVNYVADIVRKIASKLNGTACSIVYTASDGQTDCTALQRYDKYVLSKLGNKAFMLQSAINGENVGTEITYVRFDPDAPWNVGSIMDGGLEYEHISPLNFAVANPHCPSLQRQEWVMFWHDVYVGQLIAILKDEKFTDKEYKERMKSLVGEGMARSNQSDDQNPDKDILNETLLRTYVRFFRIEGEVCYTMETDYCSLFKYPRPLSTEASEALAKKVQEEFDKKAEMLQEGEDVKDDERQYRLVEDLDVDFEDTIANVSFKPTSPKDHDAYREKFNLYPFAIFTPKVQQNFLFGRSLTKELITPQKIINYLYSLNALYAQNVAWNKVYVREGAMKPGETFSVDPLDNTQHDHYKGNGNGFYTVNPPSASAEMFHNPEAMIERMKDVSGANDFANGQMTNQETSGYAVELMLKQANAPLEQEQELFWQYQKELAEIRVLFYKHYIDEAQYVYELDGAEYDEEENARQSIIDGYSRGLSLPDRNGNPIPADAILSRFGKPTPRNGIRRFRKKDIWGKDFDVQVDAQRGLVDSELATQQWYEKMFGSGGIAAFKEDPEMLKFMVESAPDASVPKQYRASLRHFANNYVNSKIRQLETQLQEATQYITYLESQIKQAGEMGQAMQDQFKQQIQVRDEIAKKAYEQSKEAQKQLEAVQGEGKSEGQIKSQNAKSTHALGGII